MMIAEDKYCITEAGPEIDDILVSTLPARRGWSQGVRDPVRTLCSCPCSIICCFPEARSSIHGTLFRSAREPCQYRELCRFGCWSRQGQGWGLVPCAIFLQHSSLKSNLALLRRGVQLWHSRILVLKVSFESIPRILQFFGSSKATITTKDR